MVYRRPANDQHECYTDNIKKEKQENQLAKENMKAKTKQTQ